MDIVAILLPELFGLAIGVFTLVSLSQNSALYRRRQIMMDIIIVLMLLIGFSQIIIDFADTMPAGAVAIAYSVILIGLPVTALWLTLIFNEFAVRNQTILSLTALLIIIIILEIIAGRLFVSNPAGPGKDYPIYITSVIIGIAVLAAVSVTDMIRNVCSKKALVIGLYLTEMSLLAYTVVNFNRFSLWSAVLMVMLFYYVFLTESQFVTDSLTGVMNANAFSRMIMDFQPTSRTAVVIADVDNLPVVNQKRNTHTGDIYLRLVSRQLTSHFLNIGMVYRISGAEFCIICQQTDKDELNQILANCKANLRQLLTGDRYGLRIEFGYAFFQPKDGRLTSTMGRAQKSVE